MTDDASRSDAAAPTTFTVCTPTYNRASTLARVYDSLRAQTFRDFEWLVVDDGSADGTDRLVAAWAAEAPFPLRYLAQRHQGKHAALNRGIAEARGEFFLMLDSDDACVPHALERFLRRWEEIPADARERFVGVTALCRDQHGRLVGTPFPRDPLDSNTLETQFRYKVKGEKWGFQRLDVLRRFPFPELEGYTGYMPEAVVWNAIAREFSTRYVNDVLRIYWRGDDESDQITRAERSANARGQELYHRRLLNEHLGWMRHAPGAFLLRGAQYARYSFHGGASAIEQLRRLRSTRARAVWIAALVPGWLAYLVDGYRERRSAGVSRP